MRRSFSPAASSSKPKVCFLFIAQNHQILHSLPIAMAMAANWPQLEVHLAASTSGQIAYIDEILRRLGAAPMTSWLMRPAWLRALRLGPASIPPKAPMLLANLGRLARYDAIVTPERTTSLLRRLQVERPLLVYTQHGAGDREGPFEPRLKLFDLAMAAGPKQRDRMVGAGLVRPENCAVVGYPKFDLVEALEPAPRSPFADDRPVVLYNPHFEPSLSSWPRWGGQVLEAFVRDERYNLIFAPHIRLFDTPRAADLKALEPYRRHPRIHVDLGGPRAVDMTYTRIADVYLGDVSSQIYEFLRKPRPALFLNAHGANWWGDESYTHFGFGPVLDRIDGLIDAIDEACLGHRQFLRRQEIGLAATFDLQPRASAARAAEAVASRVLHRVASRQDAAPEEFRVAPGRSWS